MSADIKGFFGQYRWLSNFWICVIKVKWKGEMLAFNCVEEAYQACKSTDIGVRMMFQGVGPYEAKRMGNNLTLRSDWGEARLVVMNFFIRQKFKQNPKLRDKLINTGDAHLEETNTWNDTFWGVSRGVGQNHLGKILMDVREELQS